MTKGYSLGSPFFWRVLVLCIIALVLLSWRFDGSMSPHHAVPLVQPDPRVRWEQRAVGGFILKHGEGEMTLPDGTMIFIPHPARVGEGDFPDSTC